MSLRKILVTLIILAIAAGAVTWVLQSGKKGIPVKTIKAVQGSLYSSIKATGKVVSHQETPLSALIPGQIISVHVTEGQQVAKGDVLARLDEREAKIRLSGMQAILNQARAEASQFARNLQGLRKVWRAGGASLQAVQDAETQWKSAQEREHKAQADIRTAELNLNQSAIVAPFAGIVIAKPASVGMWASPGTTLFSLVDLHARELELLVDQGDAAAVREGMDVELASDAYPGKIWNERVVRIEPAIRKEGSASNVAVRISLSATAPALRLGQQVDAKIRTAYRANAVKLPFESLIHADGKTYAAIIQNGKVDLQPVVTGIEDLTHVEILQGIKPGESVIQPEEKPLKEGDLVTPIS